MALINSIIELLELKQVLVGRVKRLNFIVLADEEEEQHSCRLITLLDSFSWVLHTLEFAEPKLKSMMPETKGDDVGLLDPLALYSLDILLRGFSILRI